MSRCPVPTPCPPGQGLSGCVTSLTSRLAPLPVGHLRPVAGVGVRAVAGLLGGHSGPEAVAPVSIQGCDRHVAGVFLRGLQGRERDRCVGVITWALFFAPGTPLPFHRPLSILGECVLPPRSEPSNQQQETMSANTSPLPSRRGKKTATTQSFTARIPSGVCEEVLSGGDSSFFKKGSICF